jgi:hypothetical protein
MTDARAIRRHLLLAVMAVLAGLAAFVVGAGPQPTDASWTATKTMAITTTAVIPAAPTALTCPGSGLLSANISFTWTAPPGTPPSGYTLKWSGAATGSSSWPTPTGTVASPVGNMTVSVYADYGDWQSPVATQVRHVLGVTIVGWTCGA